MTINRLLITFLTGALCLCSSAIFAFEINLTAQELQKRLSPHFPVRYTGLGIDLTVGPPKVYLFGASNRIGLRSSVNITLLDENVGKATARLSGRIRYRAQSGEFFLDDPVVDSIQSAQLDPRYFPLLEQALTVLARETLITFPLYTLDESRFQDRLAKKRLQSVRVEEDVLVITLDLD